MTVQASSEAHDKRAEITHDQSQRFVRILHLGLISSPQAQSGCWRVRRIGGDAEKGNASIRSWGNLSFPVLVNFRIHYSIAWLPETLVPDMTRAEDDEIDRSTTKPFVLSYYSCGPYLLADPVERSSFKSSFSRPEALHHRNPTVQTWQSWAQTGGYKRGIGAGEEEEWRRGKRCEQHVACALSHSSGKLMEAF